MSIFNDSGIIVNWNGLVLAQISHYMIRWGEVDELQIALSIAYWIGVRMFGPIWIWIPWEYWAVWFTSSRLDAFMNKHTLNHVGNRSIVSIWCDIPQNGCLWSISVVIQKLIDVIWGGKRLNAIFWYFWIVLGSYLRHFSEVIKNHLPDSSSHLQSVNHLESTKKSSIDPYLAHEHREAHYWWSEQIDVLRFCKDHQKRRCLRSLFAKRISRSRIWQEHRVEWW